MTNTLRFALISALALAACNKDSAPSQPAPVAGFSVVGVAPAAVISVGTYDPIRVTNTSTNATSYTWTLGNDSVKTGSDPGLLRYPKAGTYALTLTTRSADGQKTTVSRTVKVLDRVVKQLIIKGTRFENTSPPHAFPHPTVWAVLRLGPNHVSYPTPTSPYVSYDAPVLFKSPLVPDPTSGQFPYTFPVPGKLVLDFAAINASFLSRTEWGYTGVGYGLELYVQDDTGTYLTSSSYQTQYRSQAGSLTWQSDIEHNKFVVQYSNVELVCQYE